MNTISSIMKSARPPFLLLTPACICIGIGTAFYEIGKVDWSTVWLILIGALSAHLSVNLFNEYFDFKSGLDENTTRTPFSGGSGALPENPSAANATLIFAVLTLVLTSAVGVYFVFQQGIGLMPVGLLGLFLIASYTTWWNYQPVFCLIAPGLGFGPLMVLGTHYSLTGAYSSTALTASLIPAFLTSNLLLLNQFPDVEADKAIGRKNFPITIGLKQSTSLYGLIFILAYLSIILAVIASLLPVYCLAALITGILALKSYLGVKQNHNNIPALLPYMGMNVAINLSTPVLLSIGLFTHGLQ